MKIRSFSLLVHNCILSSPFTVIPAPIGVAYSGSNFGACCRRSYAACVLRSEVFRRTSGAVQKNDKQQQKNGREWRVSSSHPLELDREIDKLMQIGRTAMN